MNKQHYPDDSGQSQSFAEPSQQSRRSRRQPLSLEEAQRWLLQWKHNTRSANQALREQQLTLAEQRYLQALRYAEQLKDFDNSQDPHLAAFVISLHNLADFSMQTGELSKARQWLHRAFTELWHLAQQKPTAVLLPHLQVCRQELAFFCQTFGASRQSSALMQLPWPTLGQGH